jgi:hypothetical protein
MKFTDVHVLMQIRATEALLRFCTTHGYRTGYVRHVRACLRLLKEKRIEEAYDQFHVVPLCGMGSFDDWIPEGIPGEPGGNYAWAVFEALLDRWCFAMSLAVEPGRKRTAEKTAGARTGTKAGPVTPKRRRTVAKR